MTTIVLSEYLGVVVVRCQGEVPLLLLLPGLQQLLPLLLHQLLHVFDVGGAGDPQLG